MIGQDDAEKMQAAGVTVNYRVYEDVTHHFGMGAVVNAARTAVGFAAMDLREALGR